MGFRPGAKTVLFLVTSMLLGSCAATHVEKKTQVFKVNTDPPGAHVWIEDSSGKKLVGDGPTEVSYEYSVEKTEFNSNWWWSLPANTSKSCETAAGPKRRSNSSFTKRPREVSPISKGPVVCLGK